MAYCAHCGTQDLTGSFYCQKCGAIMEPDLQAAVAECPECKTPYAPLEGFCRSCGASLTDLEEYPLPDFDAITGSPLNGTLPGAVDELPSWLQNYITDTGEEERPKEAEEESEPVWLSDFSALEKSIESSAFLLPDEEEDEQPIDLTAWLKDLDLAEEASALVEQVHNSPTTEPAPQTPDSISLTEPEALLEISPLDSADESDLPVVDETPEPIEVYSGVPEEPESAAPGMELAAPEEASPEVPDLAEPEEVGTKYLRDIDEAPLPEPEPFEATPEQESAAAAEPETPPAMEEPAATVASVPRIEAENTRAQEPSGLTIHLQPVALMVPLRPPKPVSPRTEAGAVFADIGAAYSTEKAGAKGSSPASTVNRSHRSAWLIGLIVALVVIIAVAYVVLSQIVQISPTGITIGLTAIPQLLELVGL